MPFEIDIGGPEGEYPIEMDGPKIPSLPNPFKSSPEPELEAG